MLKIIIFDQICVPIARRRRIFFRNSTFPSYFPYFLKDFLFQKPKFSSTYLWELAQISKDFYLWRLKKNTGLLKVEIREIHVNSLSESWHVVKIITDVKSYYHSSSCGFTTLSEAIEYAEMRNKENDGHIDYTKYKLVIN